MRDPPVALARVGVAQGSGCDGSGGTERWEPTGGRCTGGSRGYGPSKLAPKRQRGFGDSYRGSGWAATWRSGGGRRAPAAGIGAAHTDGLMQGSESEKKGPRRLLAPGRSDCGNSPVL